MYSPPSALTLTYDIPVVVAPSADFSAFTIRDGLNVRSVLSGSILPGNTVECVLGPPGAATASRTLTYQPPPNSILSTSGTPAQSQLNFPLD